MYNSIISCACVVFFFTDNFGSKVLVYCRSRYGTAMVAASAVNDTLVNPAELHWSPEQKHVATLRSPTDFSLQPVSTPGGPRDLRTVEKK